MTVHIRVAGYQDEGSVHTRAMRVMVRAALGHAAGSFRIDFDANIAASGRKVADLLDLVRSGDVDLCYFSSSYLTGRVPALGALDIPFQFADRRDTFAHLDGALGAILAREIAARTEYEVMAFWDNGVRNLSNCKRPIRTPIDCRGLRIRTLPSAGYHATFRALGMEPVTIDVADMVEAVARGKVDAQENPLANIRLFGLHKHHRFVTMTGHFHGIALVLCNAASCASWPREVRTALSAAMSEATAAQWEFAREEEVASRLDLEAQGVSVVDLDDAARAAFDQAVRAVIEQGRAALPAELSQLLPDAARRRAT
jgi:TRAP-type transport system periplasmic protein